MNYFGTSIVNELDDVEGKNKEEISWKRQRVLRKYLYDDEEGAPAPGQFMDPAALFRK